MPNWGGLVLTNKGKNLQAKVEAGTQLSFTKIKFGDGAISGSQTLENLSDLIAPKQTVPISRVQASGDLCEITSILSNSTIEQGYYLKEMGLFATDPELGEILFAVATDTAPDYMVAGGGSVVISEAFSINLVVSNTANINAIVNPQGLVTIGLMDLAISKHDNDPNAHPNMPKFGIEKYNFTEADWTEVEGLYMLTILGASSTCIGVDRKTVNGLERLIEDISSNQEQTILTALAPYTGVAYLATTLTSAGVLKNTYRKSFTEADWVQSGVYFLLKIEYSEHNLGQSILVELLEKELINLHTDTIVQTDKQPNGSLYIYSQERFKGQIILREV